MNKQKVSLKKLFQLIKENHELPIIPMVDAEIVCDDCGRWVGSWGYAEIGKYISTDEKIYFYGLEDIDIVENFVPYEEYMSMSDEELKQAYENLPWIEAIIVNIDLPEP